MANQSAVGQLNLSQGINNSGSPVAINDLGQIIYANFFNSGAINASQNRTYSTSVTCIDNDGCPTLIFEADVGNTPTNPPTFAVRGYPEIVLVGGKWGVPGETIQQNFSASLTSSTGTEYVDHSYTIANTGYPAATNNIPKTQICLDIDEENHVGAERDVMLESWFFDRCQNTGQGNELIGTFDNNYGMQFQSIEHNNQLLEVMVHHGPINFNSNAYNDSSNGIRNQAQFYCSGPHTIGTQDYEIWYGRNGQNTVTLAGQTQTGQSNPTGALVVYNRLGPAGGPYGTDLTNEGSITLDWDLILNHAATQLQQEFINCNAWANGHANSQWTNPTSLDNPFTRINDPDCGAVGGIEFGLEPQLNGPNDLPVRTIVNKLDVIVDGERLGPTPEECIELKPSDCCSFEVQLTEQDCCQFSIQLLDPNQEDNCNYRACQPSVKRNMCIEYPSVVRMPVIFDQSDLSLPPFRPFCEPHFGELNFDGEAYVFSFPEDVYGKTVIKVPRYYNGCCKSFDEATITVLPTRPPYVVSQCRVMLMAKNECYTDFQPIGRINQWSVNENVEINEYTEENTKRNLTVPPSQLPTWSFSLTGDSELELSSQRVFNVGCLTDIELVAILSDNSLKTIRKGTVRIDSCNISGSASEDNVQFSLSGIGHGGLISLC